MKKKEKRNFKFGRQELTLLVKLVAVILLWRGVWGLADLYVFPDRPGLSFLASTLVGILVLWADDWSLGEFAYLKE